MSKILILLCFLLASTTYAADFTITFQPAPNSVNNTTVADNSLSSSKINNFALDVISSISPSLASYLLKSEIVDCPVNKKLNSLNGVFSCENISVGDTEVSSLSQSKITGLDSALSSKVNSSSLGSLAFKSSLLETDIPSLSIAKVTNLQTSLDAKASVTALNAKADTSSLGSLAFKSLLSDTDIPSILSSKISDFVSAVNALIAAALNDKLTPVAFSAAQTSTPQSIPHVTRVDIIMNTKRYDTHNAYNTATGVFTVPQAGKYSCYCIMTYGTFNPGVVTLEMFILKNGGAVSARYMTTSAVSNPWTLDLSARDAMNVGDQLTCAAYQNSGAARPLLTSGPQFNNFSCEKIAN